MGQNSKIEWCDHTWNPWMGCTKVGPPCDHCYAERDMDLRYGRVRWGAGEDRIRTSVANWNLPLRWDRAAAAASKIATVFCLSLGDIWDNEVDPLWRRDAFAVMERTPNLLYLLLSKRIGNACKMCDPLAGNPPLPRNAALGATMATQDEWDRDLPKLMEAGRDLGARFTFASVEPMLGPIDARGDLPDWLIVGGESGPSARPMHPYWARSLKEQSAAAGIPFLFKQWGNWKPGVSALNANGFAAHVLAVNGAISEGDKLEGCDQRPRWVPIKNVGKKAAGRLLDGVEWNQMPEISK
jgi:protein gp37